MLRIEIERRAGEKRDVPPDPREIGSRMALGASRQHVLGWVLARSFTLVALGALLGIGGALTLGSVLQQVLYVPTTDPLSLVAGIAALAATAVSAAGLATGTLTRGSSVGSRDRSSELRRGVARISFSV